MKINTRWVDHLVYCVPNLEASIEDLEKRLGVRAEIGGKHTSQGTKNALINLGNNCYLELLAIDEENDSVIGNRWMGIDLIEQAKLTRWSIKTTDIILESALLNKYNKDLSEIKEGSRLTPTGQILRWRMTIPLAQPEVELAPFLLDWSDSDAHPTDKLTQHCHLKELKLYSSPSSSKVSHCLADLDLSGIINDGATTKIKALIDGPNGLVEL